jgi:hypothetical protein
MNDTTQLGAYTGIVSVFMPLIVATVVQSHWRKEVKGAVALIASLVAGFGSLYFGKADLKDLGVVIPLILVASQASYHTFWKPTGLVPFLEQATNLDQSSGSAGKPAST